MNPKLWQPIQVGNIKLNHRLAMATMSRCPSTGPGRADGLERRVLSLWNFDGAGHFGRDATD
jgi:2,4-dienoyl-CoA reductase-like NADH-dependent reductase (Old Yellow Enzyme family)